MRILGIDPGSVITGFGIIEKKNNKAHYVTSGFLLVGNQPWPERLKKIYIGITEVIEEYSPKQVAIEQVFVHKNAQTALKLGQARGAAIAACACGGMLLSEYATKQVKQAVSGFGGAKKFQIQHMIQLLLKLETLPSEDAADALAIALCHQQIQNFTDIIDRNKT